MFRIEEDATAEISEQLFILLSTLTDGESYDLTYSAGVGEGLQAWRRPHKRYNPYTATRARTLLKNLLGPRRCNKMDEFLNDLGRYLELRDPASGTKCTLAEDIRMASKEAMLPSGLESHIHLNCRRLPSYHALRAEIVSIIEAKEGARRAASSGGGGGPKPMEVDVLKKELVALKQRCGIQNEGKQCYNCGDRTSGKGLLADRRCIIFAGRRRLRPR